MFLLPEFCIFSLVFPILDACTDHCNKDYRIHHNVRWLVFIAEEFDGVGGKGSGDTATVYMQTLLYTSVNMSLKSSRFVDGSFCLVKCRTGLGDYFPEVPD